MLFSFVIFVSFGFVASLSQQEYSLTGSYNVEQTILMLGDDEDPVGYKVTSKLSVTPKGPDVYLMKLKDLGLHIMSRKAPTPHGFVPHSSKLESTANKDFIIIYKGGLISSIYLSNDETTSIRNIKRAIASAFQFKSDLNDGVEKDSSGLCNVVYEKNSNSDSIVKTKTGCIFSTPTNLTSDVWGATRLSESKIKIKLDNSNNKISSVLSSESHRMESHLAAYIIARVTSSLSIEKTSDSGESGSMEYTGTSEEVVENILIEIGSGYTKYDLILEKESDPCLTEKCPSLEDVVKESKFVLSNYGSSKSANAILKVANAMRQTKHQQIYKILNSKDNKKNLGVLLDIAGSVQTPDSHQAVLKKLKINTDKYNLDNCERYFWALSLYPKPSLNITKEVIAAIKEKHHDKKLFQTMLQTGASMVHRLAVLNNNPNHELVTELVEILKEELINCDSDDEVCRQQYLTALGQIGSSFALPSLIKFSTTSTMKSSVTALKGILKLGSSLWTPQVFKLAEQVLHSVRGFDSSAKAIALDIVMSQQLSDVQIKRLLALLTQRENKEINQLILQKLYHKASSCEQFSIKLDRLMKEECNWNHLAQGGLSTSFSRHFMDKGFLSTDQEISNGILKRGLVHVNLEHNNSINTLFTLGLFSSGLTSFVSSNQDSGEEEEEATAGMQIQLLGVDFRPFVFFSGSGDLMGHVWSGTASSKTPAYQAALVVNRNEGLIPIGPAGAWADLSLDTAASLELAGLIEISLWNRNANSAVYNRMGLSVGGGIKVNTDFVKTKIDLHLNAEPSLDLTSQIDFSSSVSLCLKLYQPSSVIKYNTYKVERISGSKHRLRKSRYTTRPVPGRTYALNQKNNEMCNTIHRTH